MNSNLKDKYLNAINRLNEEIKDKKSLEIALNLFNELFEDFLDDIKNVSDAYETKIQKIEAEQEIIKEKMKKVEGSISNMEKEFFVGDESFDFEIVCPYCNHEFVTEESIEDKAEIVCPECNNIIELDWETEDDENEGGCCSGFCGTCGGCGSDNSNDDTEIDEDDDM